MESLLWDEKLDRIKAFSIRRETRGFIHEECFDTHTELIRAEMPQPVCRNFVSLVSAAARRSPKPLGLVQIQGGTPDIGP